MSAVTSAARPVGAARGRLGSPFSSLRAATLPPGAFLTFGVRTVDRFCTGRILCADDSPRTFRETGRAVAELVPITLLEGVCAGIILRARASDEPEDVLRDKGGDCGAFAAG